MARYIRNRQIAELPEGERLIPIAAWHGGDGEPHDNAALLLGPADDPALIAGRLGSISVIAIEFPLFTDGRGYSIARLLRERVGYTGEIRAVGDVPRDSLAYLASCGFDAFVLGEDADLAAALASLEDFSESYQSSVRQPQPLFRRRLAAAA